MTRRKNKSHLTLQKVEISENRYALVEVFKEPQSFNGSDMMVSTRVTFQDAKGKDLKYTPVPGDPATDAVHFIGALTQEQIQNELIPNLKKFVHNIGE